MNIDTVTYLLTSDDVIGLIGLTLTQYFWSLWIEDTQTIETVTVFQGGWHPPP